MNFCAHQIESAVGPRGRDPPAGLIHSFLTKAGDIFGGCGAFHGMRICLCPINYNSTHSSITAWLVADAERAAKSTRSLYSGKRMNSVSPGTGSKRPVFQSSLACSMRSLLHETKSHQI
jgi:hypothetical protein